MQVNSISWAYHVMTPLTATIPAPLAPALPVPGIDLVWRWDVPRNSLDHTLCSMLIRLARPKKVSATIKLCLWGDREAKCLSIFSCKILSRFCPFYPQTFRPSCSYNRGKRFFILVIVEINCMTQIKKKVGFCKSVVIATVVAIRDVVKNGFHCIAPVRHEYLHEKKKILFNAFH